VRTPDGLGFRLPANRVLQEKIGYLLKRPVGRPPHEVRRYYASFSYQAQSWKKPRRVVAKVEWHPGELYPRVGFIVIKPSAAGRARGGILQPARHCRAVDQRREGSDQVDAYYAVPSLPMRFALSSMRWPTILPTSCEPWRCPRLRSCGL
jgi:DDE family transposase